MVVLSGLSAAASAQQPMGGMLQGRLPPRGVSKASGLYLQVADDGLGVGQFGYRRLFFSVHSPKPNVGDTQITVRTFVSDWNPSRNTVAVETDGVLLDGQTTATIVVRIPQTNEWNQAWWDVWIDGAHEAALSVMVEQPRQLNNVGNSRWQNSQMLRLDASPISAIPFAKQLADQVMGRGITQAMNRGRIGLVINGELSDNWLDYTPYDLVSLDFPTLKATTKNNPDKFAALEAWVRAGGNLWIEQVGDDWDKLSEIHALFNWARTDNVEPTRPEGKSLAGVERWSYVNLRPRSSTANDDGLVQDYDPSVAPPETTARSAIVEPAYSEDWFVVRRHGWGTVAAFDYTQEARPRNVSRSERESAAQFWNERSWPLRHGTVPGMANNDFSNWLIPGVGLAPVVSFQVLITLFVLAIGPLNYWLLKRAGRLHLMVLTVPLAALAITAALLGYGILSDGFATRLRAQSITLLDQQTGDAATWSRLSYYAAFAPQQGLIFSDETAVFPIHPGSMESYDVDLALAQRDLVWAPGEQRLTQGWLNSRTPTQYLTVQPRNTKAKLKINSSPEGGTVENQFRTTAELIVAVDEEGQWRMVEEVPAGEQADLEVVEQTDAVAAIREILSGREPQFPTGFTAVEDSPLLYDQRRRIRRNYRNQNRDYGSASASQSLLQDKWAELLGFGGLPALELPAQSYLMVCNQAPLPLSVDELGVEDSSVHLVVGRW